MNHRGRNPGLEATKLVYQSKINKLVQASKNNYKLWLNGKQKHKRQFLIDKYPQLKKSKDIRKLAINQTYCDLCSTLVTKLRNMTYHGPKIHFMHLDGSDTVTSTMLTKAIPSVPSCNILVPNFTDAHFNMDSDVCTPLFMPVGPVIADVYKKQFPEDVKLSNFANLVEDMSLLFAAIWLDYCSAPPTVIKDLIKIIPKIKFAPLAIFAVTVSTRQGRTECPWHMEDFEDFVLNLLQEANKDSEVRLLMQPKSKSTVTFFWTITT